MPELNPELLNKLLLARAKDLVRRRPVTAKEFQGQRATEDGVKLQRALGLLPFPSQSPLDQQSLGTLDFEGYRLEKIVFQSRPGFHVPAHLYVPSEGASLPAVIYAPDKGWSRASPWVQSAGIGLALLGFACLIIDPPGSPERATQGNLDVPHQALGLPLLGEYVWDVIRGIDFLATREDVLIHRVGTTGCGFGGHAAMMAFALEPRICSAVPVCSGGSLESMHELPDDLRGVGGLLQLGDINDIVSLRLPDPALFLAGTEDSENPPQAQQRTEQKLRASLKLYKAEDRVEQRSFLGGRDYNRRMREAMYAFFSETLKITPPREYINEPRPLTDGSSNLYPCGTMPEDSPELVCRQAASSLTYDDLLKQLLADTYPEEFDPVKKLVGWSNYFRLTEFPGGGEMTLSDELSDDTDVALPGSALDQAMCMSIDLSIPEFFAQILHQTLPGRPEGWEQTALSSHALTSMFASVKTLVSGTNPSGDLNRVVANGPLASLTALFLRAYRPGLEIAVSHPWSSWKEIVESGNTLLFQPGARYLRWPFSSPSLSQEVTNA